MVEVHSTSGTRHLWGSRRNVMHPDAHSTLSALEAPLVECERTHSTLGPLEALLVECEHAHSALSDLEGLLVSRVGLTCIVASLPCYNVTSLHRDLVTFYLFASLPLYLVASLPRYLFKNEETCSILHS